LRKSLSIKGKIFSKKIFLVHTPCTILLHYFAIFKKAENRLIAARHLQRTQAARFRQAKKVYFVLVCGYHVHMSKTDFKRTIMLLTLAVVITLIVLSVYGAFVGAERARELFNSVPMQMFWSAITIALVASLVLFPSLFKRPSLLLIHLGCIGVLAGSIWASETGHKIQKQLFGKEKIRSGVMVINEGKMDDKVIIPEQRRSVELPFHIGLKEFRVEYYDTPGPDGRQVPRDYFSDVSVVKDSKVVKTKTIEVNKPLHYGGYYFYQRSFEERGGEYAVLAVVSDNGLSAVFTGYVLLVAGLFGRCWLAPTMRER
jgi:hypothetical protein